MERLSECTEMSTSVLVVSKGHIVYEYKLNKGSDDIIYEKISDICISMKAEDYLELPEKVIRDVSIQLSSKVQKMYNDFEEEQVLQLIDMKYRSIRRFKTNCNMPGQSMRRGGRGMRYDRCIGIGEPRQQF